MSDFANKSLEWCFRNQEISAFLVLPDLSQCNSFRKSKYIPATISTTRLLTARLPPAPMLSSWSRSWRLARSFATRKGLADYNLLFSCCAYSMLFRLAARHVVVDSCSRWCDDAIKYRGVVGFCGVVAIVVDWSDGPGNSYCRAHGPTAKSRGTLWNPVELRGIA
jgi:hypothetical protein